MMVSENEYFQNAERPSYELAYLLRRLPAHFGDVPGEELQEVNLMLEAASRHAANFRDTLLHGQESIAHLMWSASVNKVNQLNPVHVAGASVLMAEIACQLQFITEFIDAIAERNLEFAQKRSLK